MNTRSQPSLWAAAGLVALLLPAGVVLAQSDGRVPQFDSPAEGRAVPIDVSPPIAPAPGSESVVLPVPTSSPAVGTGLQVLAARFFRTDETSQASVLGFGAGYYTSDTWFTGVGGLLNLSDGRWRLSGGIGYIQANYDFYGVGTGAGGRDVPFPITQTGTGAFAKVERKVAEGWYVGAGYRYLDSEISLRGSAPNYPAIEAVLREGVRLVSSGPTLSATYDTRDLNTNPSSGSYVSAEAILATQTLFDSDEDYQRVDITANHYIPLSEKYTLAGRLALCRASENTPFFDLCLFGTNSNLRGYTVGRYQDRSLFAVQTELRAQLRPRWGAVVFAGVGEVAPDFGEMNADDLLPAAGVGLRWMAAPENKVNISADLAWGKGEDMTFYLSIGEAF
jgi:hypothetical protein